MTRHSIPNLLGLFRIITTPLLVLFILAGSTLGYVAAILLLLLMAISDIADGRLARKFKVVSPLGVFLDTISDKIFVAGALIPMVQQELISSWVVILIIGRDFAVSGLRSYAAAQGEVIPARAWGKQKLTIIVIALIWRLVAAALVGVATPPFVFTFEAIAGPLVVLAQIANMWPIPMALALIWTIGSGIEYFWNARPMLIAHWSPQPTSDAPPSKSP
ncbi:MAG: CDP-diacylglycerol--glycerol-3-phosphate 3-phosphatidyltransferase [Chloroflexi bacterium AL-W]|nr:CDP-diacylglycerol--glycerol-3-phosphate 3-phosphatidyltransferase [Chloroflexi bacterium AL-N1]NOK68791.1 CDP-diacylglycerol--glycerol-3-phosphate 3-phosphatidyltransferase [Chloroflexi bacterium AL-N10]NOK76277.1 CDP-diacylglycerol--glycerol-3-phosphate 3-phosphatidyltransferase [Chloroflexi bacterium AL-N5]NOK84086.1 CDP-diacylglycerol--glycerol-3-phosphate 3-phosphatidyltransferase [Chloroflexi bacterium AL-W]NOK91415.1 CDP-diacylglycerol--glycerol-3-phosphate 3-phosphatidyltransferase [